MSPRVIFLSSTFKSTVFILVDVPFTVKFPDNVKSVPKTAPVNVAPESAA